MRLDLWLWGGNLHRPGPEFRPSLPLDSLDSIPLVPNRWNLFPSTLRSGAQRMLVHLGGTPEVHHGAPCVPWLTVRLPAKPAAQKRGGARWLQSNGMRILLKARYEPARKRQSLTNARSRLG